MEQHVVIKPIGTVLRVDEEGYLVSQSSADKIIDPWSIAVDAVVVLCREIFGSDLHSVYVRGSASRGGAIVGLSDLDTVIVIRRKMSEVEKLNLRNGRKDLEQKYSFCTDIEISSHQFDELISGKDRGFALLKIYSACVWGDDIIPQLPKIKPGKEAVMHAGGFKRRIDEHLDEFGTGERIFNQEWCTWIMKRLLRVGGELIMEREQVFVRDLYPCYELFAKHYPDKKVQMRQVLELALNPTKDLEAIRDLVNDMSGFLDEEVNKVFKN